MKDVSGKILSEGDIVAVTSFDGELVLGEIVLLRKFSADVLINSDIKIPKRYTQVCLVSKKEDLNEGHDRYIQESD